MDMPAAHVLPAAFVASTALVAAAWASTNDAQQASEGASGIGTPIIIVVLLVLLLLVALLLAIAVVCYCRRQRRRGLRADSQVPPATSETRVPIVRSAEPADGRAVNGDGGSRDGKTKPDTNEPAVDEKIDVAKATLPVHATPSREKEARLKKKKFYNSSELPFIDEYFPAARDEYSV